MTESVIQINLQGVYYLLAMIFNLIILVAWGATLTARVRVLETWTNDHKDVLPTVAGMQESIRGLKSAIDGLNISIGRLDKHLHNLDARS